MMNDCIDRQRFVSAWASKLNNAQFLKYGHVMNLTRDWNLSLSTKLSSNCVEKEEEKGACWVLQNHVF